MDGEGDERAFVGYAATFYRAGEPGTEFQLGPNLVERIMPGAFDAVISERQDVRGLFNHDPNLLLGRTTSGTLTLSVDDRGLRYSIRFDENDADHRNLAAKMERGDVTGSSFGFSIRGEDGQEFTRDGATDVRELRALDVFDVSPVTFPAYTASESYLRSAWNAHGQWEKEQRKLQAQRHHEKHVRDAVLFGKRLTRNR